MKMFIMTIAVSVVAALGSVTPAHADDRTSHGSSGVSVRKVDHPPRWVQVERTQSRVKGGVKGNVDSVHSDWGWWPPGWTIDFNRSETNRMAFAFGTCLTIVGVFMPAPWAIALYGSCAAVAIMAGWAALENRCLRAWVPVQGWPISLSKVRC